MSNLTPELNLAMAVDSDDTADYLTLPSGLAGALLTLDGLFSAATGHSHVGAHQGGALGAGSVGTTQLQDGSVTAAKLSTTIQAVPPGCLTAFAGVSAPAGYLLCDGSPVSRTTYAALFTAIGTLYGAGDGTTTFNLPDLRGRVPVGAGQGSGLTNRGLGGSGGEENHTLSMGEMPAHNHSISDPTHSHTEAAHNHTVNDPKHQHPSQVGGDPFQGVHSGSGIGFGSGGYSLAIMDLMATGVTINNATSGINAASTGITAAVNGSGATHNNMQPFVAVNFIIKT